MSGLRRFTATEPRAGLPERDSRPDPLRRFLVPRQESRPGEVCELCGEPVRGDHPHLVDPGAQRLLCVCRACHLLFERPGAGGGGYRAVPDRVLRLAPFVLSPAEWSALDIPVGMVFLMRSSALGRTVALYPSPAGATESELSLDAWGSVVAANPALEGLEPDVEAALLRRVGDETECYLLPIDRCYELVGQLRLWWRGFDGGQEVRERIATFFDELRARSTTVSGGPRAGTPDTGGDPRAGTSSVAEGWR